MNMNKQKILKAVTKEVKEVYGSEMLMADGSKMEVNAYLNKFIYPYLYEEDYEDEKVADIAFEMIELDCALDIDFRF